MNVRHVKLTTSKHQQIVENFCTTLHASHYWGAKNHVNNKQQQNCPARPVRGKCFKQPFVHFRCIVKFRKYWGYFLQTQYVLLHSSTCSKHLTTY